MSERIDIHTRISNTYIRICNYMIGIGVSIIIVCIILLILVLFEVI